jgi:hypothetical protein
MGLITRREFIISGALGGPMQQKADTIRVEIMEVFMPTSGPSALLVHHAGEATRETFANWLRVHSGSAVVCTLPDKARIDARIFRVSACFGRGLILLREPASLRAKDILNILEDAIV